MYIRLTSDLQSHTFSIFSHIFVFFPLQPSSLSFSHWMISKKFLTKDKSFIGPFLLANFLILWLIWPTLGKNFIEKKNDIFRSNKYVIVLLIHFQDHFLINFWYLKFEYFLPTNHFVKFWFLSWFCSISHFVSHHAWCHTFSHVFFTFTLKDEIKSYGLNQDM